MQQNDRRWIVAVWLCWAGVTEARSEDFALPYPGGELSHLGRASKQRGLVKPVMEMQTTVARLCQWKRTICIQAPGNSAGHGQ